MAQLDEMRSGRKSREMKPVFLLVYFQKKETRGGRFNTCI